MDQILQKLAILEEKLRKLRLKRLILLLPVAFIIALIPLIMLIFDMEQRSFYRTALDIKEAALENCSGEDTYSLIVFGRMMENEFPFQGDLPDSGRIAVNSDCQVALALYDGENCALKYFWDEIVEVDKRKHEDCIIYRDIFDATIVAEKIDEGYIPISSVADLEAIGSDKEYTFAKDTLYELTIKPTLDKNYILTNDLDLKDSNFVTIGSVQEPFTGIFDGYNHKIENYRVDLITGKSNEEKQELINQKIGFFSKLENAKIKNFYLSIDIKGFNYIGGLVLTAENSEIINTTITGQINGYDHIGGIAQNAKNLKISETKVDLKIKGNDRISGMIVYGENISIENSYLKGNIFNEKIAVDFIYQVISITDDKPIIIKNSYSVLEFADDDLFRMVRFGGNSAQIIDSYHGVNEINIITRSAATRLFSDLEKKETYKNWDFDEIWEIVNKYPSLQNEK